MSSASASLVILKNFLVQSVAGIRLLHNQLFDAYKLPLSLRNYNKLTLARILPFINKLFANN